MVEEEKKEIPAIRTMKSDAEMFVKQKGISDLEIAASSYTAGQKIRQGLQNIQWKKVLLMAISVAVLVVAGYFIFQFLSSKLNKQPMLEEPKHVASFLPVEDERVISFKEINPGALISNIQQELTKILTFGTIIYFPIEFETRTGEKRFAASQEFIRFVSWKPPMLFLDFMHPDFNTLVLHSKDGQALAVIIKTKNYERAYSSLLEWEKTMWLDWKPFLKSEDIVSISGFSFKDEIVANHDARVLQNKETRAILAYAIFNKELVIITTSREALATVISRLIKLPPR